MTTKRKIFISITICFVVLCAVLLMTEIVFAQASSTSESGNIFYRIWRAIAYPFEYLSGELGKLFIGMAVWFLGIAGSIFDMLIEHTILKFASTLKSTGLMENIEQVWEAFRDVGNIVIIGMFVFVAISIILGLQTYGEKKMIARLLIVAILINFSLFFTKVVIDASHITAIQFYKGIVNTTNQGSQQASAGSTETVKIADAFLDKTGISSTFDTGKFIEKINTDNGSPFVTIIAYTSLASLFIMTIAIIFLYGSFLLASRGILLVILMITSSLAFASYLIPSLDGGKYGWKVWRDTLLKASFMAPLLLLFIWASLFILQSGGTGNENTIGVFLNNPTDTNSWEAIWLLILSVGLLMASIKMSQSLSNGITGFKLSAKFPGLGLAAASRITGYVGRPVIGGGASKIGDMLNSLNKSLGRRGRETGIERAFMRRLDNLQNFTYDPLSTKRGRSFLKDTAGIEVEKDVGKGGYRGDLGRKAEKGIKQSEAVSLTSEEKEKVKQATIDASKAANSVEYNIAEKDKTNNQQILEQALQEKARHANQIEKLTSTYANAKNEIQRRQAEIELDEYKTGAEYTAVEERIKKARKAVTDADRVTSRIDREAEKAGEEAVKTIDEKAVNLAKRTTHRRAGTLWGAIGTPETDPAAKQVVSVIKKKKGQSRLKDALKDFADSGAPPPPPQQKTGSNAPGGS